MQGSLDWIAGTFVCLSTFPLTYHSRRFLPSESQAKTVDRKTESIQMYFKKQENHGYLGHCSVVATTLSFL